MLNGRGQSAGTRRWNCTRFACLHLWMMRMRDFFFCACRFNCLAPEVYPRWGPGLSRCLCCVAIANKTPASLQTVYCSVPVACVSACVPWKASLRPIADLFCKRSVVCGPATRATFRATSDLVINGRRRPRRGSVSMSGVDDFSLL